MKSRRSLLIGGASLIAAPYIARAGSISLLGAGVVSSGGGGGVTVDAISTLQVLSNVGPTSSWTHTPVGTPTAVAVLLNNFDGGVAGLPASGVTYGGVSMVKAQSIDDANLITTELWGLANPSAGPQTIVVTYHEPSGNFCLAASMTVIGSDTTTCFRNSNSATGTGTTSSVTVSSAANDLVVDFVGSTATLTVGGSQSQKWNGVVSGDKAAGSTLAGAASVSMTWTLGSSVTWGAVAGSFKHA